MVLILLVHIFGHVLIVVHYKSNKEFISAKFCVNKTKPKINCNGKCHLQKKLKELTASSEDNNSKPTIEFSQYLISEPYTTIVTSFIEIKKSYPDSNAKNETLGHILSIFHPPLI